MYTESPPLNDEYPENDVDASDAHGEGASSHRVHRLRRGTSLRSSSFTDAQFALDGPSITRRIIRVLAPPSIAVLIGVGATLAWQCYGREMVGAWVPSLAWLLPASRPGPPVTSAELQTQLKPVALDLAIVRRSVEQLATNQDQLARKEDQMRQAFATLRAAEQDIDQKILALAPPAPRAAHVPPPKSLQPPAQ
jgi:hypothetical protein